MTRPPTPASSPTDPPHRPVPAAAPHVRLLRLLITGVPKGVAVRVIAAVTATLSMLGILLFGALSDTEFGPHLQEVITVGVAVPLIVVLPFASVAIQLVRQLEQERASAIALAEVDPLTGLVNRRRFADLLERDVAIAARGARTWMIAVLDIDDFKSVNDRHGHGAGDALLRAVAHTCRHTLRATDVVARWGGEEFVLLLPHAGSDGGSALLERLRAAIATTVIRDDANRPISRTVSIGGVVVSMLPPQCRPAPAHQLIEQADRAMYLAKQLGRNRVVIERAVATRDSDGSPARAWKPRRTGDADRRGPTPAMTPAGPALGAPGGRSPVAQFDAAPPNRGPSQTSRETV